MKPPQAAHCLGSIGLARSRERLPCLVSQFSPMKTPQQMFEVIQLGELFSMDLALVQLDSQAQQWLRRPSSRPLPVSFERLQVLRRLPAWRRQLCLPLGKRYPPRLDCSVLLLPLLAT